MKPLSCDRHKNVQMIPFSLDYPGGTVAGHLCPVSSCGRHHTEDGYFDLVDGKPTREEKTIRNRIVSVRNEILRAIRAGA
jgi:hypothetical protein